MEYPKLETALLKDVDDRFYFGAECRSCLHTSRLRLTRLRQVLGDEFPIKQIRARLKCELCGGREVVITYLTPEQGTGSLVHLFSKEPRR